MLNAHLSHDQHFLPQVIGFIDLPIFALRTQKAKGLPGHPCSLTKKARCDEKGLTTEKLTTEKRGGQKKLQLSCLQWWPLNLIRSLVGSAKKNFCYPETAMKTQSEILFPKHFSSVIGMQRLYDTVLL